MSFTNSDLEEFKIEAAELLELAERSLLSLSDTTSSFENAFDNIFRCFHNLKGAAGMMELFALQDHTHELETLLMTFKDRGNIPPDYVDLFLKGIDGARQILLGQEIKFNFEISEQPPTPNESIKSSESDAPVSEKVTNKNDLQEFYDECNELIERAFEKSGNFAGSSTEEDLESLYRDIHSLKGTLFLFCFDEAGRYAHDLESKLDLLRDGKNFSYPDLTELLFEGLKKIEALLQAKTNPNHNLGEPLMNNDKEKLEPGIVKAPTPENKSSIDEKEIETASSIRVSVSILDNLMTLIGEMVLVRNQVLQFSNQTENLDFLNLSKRLNVVTNEIQGEIMKTRMQPIGNILGKFNRVIRDLSKELKKEIALQVEGVETELDKSLLEAIKDPLMHIVRNACDHGIESPELRASKSKDKIGNIKIKAYHEGGQVIIEVKDDGRGLDREILIKKALEKGLVTASQASQLTDQEAFHLIFAPGFSTASAITNLSGRGVGMDVVLTNIEKIGGNVELESVLGRGTTIRLKIPLTLAIVPALIIRSFKETFAIPQVKLEELIRVDSSSNENRIEYLHGQPVYRLRGQILPLVGLNKILKNEENTAGEIFNVAVVRAENSSFGLIVDEIVDTCDIVVKPLNKLLKSLQIYSGATILGDGTVALILDIMGISKKYGLEVESDEKKVSSNETRSNYKSSESQDYLFVRLATETMHAFLLNDVYRLENFSSQRIESTSSGQVVRYGDKVLPLLRLNEFFKYPSHDLASDQIPVVVVEKSGNLFGLVVDEIVDTVSIEAAIFNSIIKNSGTFGELNLPDRIVTVIDSHDVIRKQFSQGPMNMPKLGDTRKPLRILLVEDTPIFRKEISKILDRAGHSVFLANDGEEALAKIENESQQFDLIISDIEMPRMNGFELAKNIRRNPAIKSIPLIALSSKTDETYLKKGLSAGFDQYLEKLETEVLLNTIRNLTKEAA